MKIEDLYAASQLSKQLDNVRALKSRDYCHIIRGRGSDGRLFFCEHSDSSGGKIELSEEEVKALQSVIDAILDQRKIFIELAIADL